MANQHSLPGATYLQRVQAEIIRKMQFLMSMGFVLKEAQVSREAWVTFKRGTDEIWFVHEPCDWPRVTIQQVRPAKYKEESITIPESVSQSVGATAFRLARDTQSELSFLNSLDSGESDAVMVSLIANYARTLSQRLANGEAVGEIIRVTSRNAKKGTSTVEGPVARQASSRAVPRQNAKKKAAKKKAAKKKTAKKTAQTRPRAATKPLKRAPKRPSGN